MVQGLKSYECVNFSRTVRRSAPSSFKLFELKKYYVFLYISCFNYEWEVLCESLKLNCLISHCEITAKQIFV